MQNVKQVTSALVLRRTETKEADMILTVLTPDLGKISLIARGARRKNSKIAAACQLLAYSEVTVYERGNWYYLSEASTIELFDPLRQDFEKLSLASYFAELTEAVSDTDTAPELLPLLLNALYALTHLSKEPRLIKTAFELRLMTVSGFAPLCDGCAVCGTEEMAQPMLDVVQGVVHCAGCKTEGGLSLPLPGGALPALRYVTGCEAKKLYSFQLTGTALRALNHASEALISAQLERNFRTLDYYKSVTDTQGVHHE